MSSVTLQPRRKRAASRPAPRRRAAAPGAARRRSAAPKATPKARPAAAPLALPGWGDLAGQASGARRRTARPSRLEGVTTLRFGALVLLACALFTLYVGHVYATQELAAEVQQLRREHLRLILKQNRLQGEASRMTSPAVVLERAAAIGLQPGGEVAPTIVLD